MSDQGQGTATEQGVQPATSSDSSESMEPGVRPDGKSAVVMLGNEPKVIHKLKAGKFYEAQKHFADVYGSLADMLRNKDIREIATTQQEVMQQNAGKTIDDGELTSTPNQLTPDQLDKLASESGAGMIQKLLAETPMKLARFVAVCCEMTEEELLDTAYPNEISDAFDICYKLNDVMENLKKFGAPMQALA